MKLPGHSQYRLLWGVMQAGAVFVSLAFVRLCEHASQLDDYEVGTATKLVVLAVYFAWLRKHVAYGLETGRPNHPVAKAGLSLVIIPVGIISGRMLFSIIPPWDPHLGVWTGGIASALVWKFLAAPLPLPRPGASVPQEVSVGGRRPTSGEAAQARALELIRQGRKGGGK